MKLAEIVKFGRNCDPNCVLQMYLSLSLYSSFLLSFCWSGYDQMSQRIKVSKIAHWKCSLNVFVIEIVIFIHHRCSGAGEVEEEFVETFMTCYDTGESSTFCFVFDYFSDPYNWCTEFTKNFHPIAIIIRWDAIFYLRFWIWSLVHQQSILLLMAFCSNILTN